MSLTEHIVTAPAGEREVLLVRLNHPTWGTPLRYADDVEDWTVTDEESNSATFTATGADADGEPTDDTGIDSRGISVPDPDIILWRRFEVLSQAGDSTPVEVTVYRYLSSDLTEPAAYAILSLTSPSRDGRVVSFEASNANAVNRDAPPRRYTYSNSPGLRR
jgi:hypothetical protein